MASFSSVLALMLVVAFPSLVASQDSFCGTLMFYDAVLENRGMEAPCSSTPVYVFTFPGDGCAVPGVSYNMYALTGVTCLSTDVMCNTVNAIADGGEAPFVLNLVMIANSFMVTYYGTMNVYTANVCSEFTAVLSYRLLMDGSFVSPSTACVDLPENYECDKPHDDVEGICTEITTSTSSFRATGDHLISTPEGWKLVRELRVGDVLRSGIVETIQQTVCKSLNSCRTEDKKFEAYGEIFAQNALITPDNYLDMLMD